MLESQGLKDLDYNLVSNKKTGVKIPASCWHPGPDDLSQKGLNLPNLWRHPLKAKNLKLSN